MSKSIGNFVALYKDVSGTYEAFGGEVSSSISITKDNIETTTKDSVDDAGNFVKEFDGSGEYTFSFSVEGIQSVNSDVPGKINDLMSGNKIKFRFGYNVATQTCYEGDGYIMSIDLDASKNEAVTYSAEIQGTSGLNLVTVSA